MDEDRPKKNCDCGCGKKAFYKGFDNQLFHAPKCAWDFYNNPQQLETLPKT